MCSMWHALLLAVTVSVGCEPSSSDPAPAPNTAASALTSSPSVSGTPLPAPTPSATPSTATVASLRKAATEDPSAFEGESVTIDAFFLQVAQAQYGTGEHPRHSFAKVDVVLAPFVDGAPSAPDPLACYYPERSWPPRGLNPGDPIVVSGRWSFAKLLPGGWRPDGGALSIAACTVTRAAATE